MKLRIQAIAVVSSIIPVSVSAEPANFLCNSPSGYANYTSELKGWKPDGMTDGVFELTFAGNLSDVSVGFGKPVKKLSSEGVVMPLFEREDFFALAVLYPKNGIIENFAVSRAVGTWQLLWTQIRDAGLSKQPGKVAAYSAKCVRK